MCTKKEPFDSTAEHTSFAVLGKFVGTIMTQEEQEVEEFR